MEIRLKISNTQITTINTRIHTFRGGRGGWFSENQHNEKEEYLKQSTNHLKLTNSKSSINAPRKQHINHLYR